MNDFELRVISRPMLAATVEEHQLQDLDYPVLVSPKIDGIRVLVHPHFGPVTRKFKEVPNQFIQEWLDRPAYHHLDGEIVLRGGNFNSTQSAVMARSGTPSVEYWVFDCFQDPDERFSFRDFTAYKQVYDLLDPDVKHVEQLHAHSEADILYHAKQFISEGYEGLMIRSPNGIYKEGRSTLKQGYLIKFKNFADAEGTVIGFEELMHNDNPQERDELGYAKRSSHKANQVPTGRLGALVLSTEWGELRVGSGFDQQTRTEIWHNREEYLGKQVTFKYQASGMQDKPRFPIFLHFRDERG